MLINSSYYEDKFKFSKWDLNVIYSLYEKWCNENIQHAEVDRDSFIDNPNDTFDHVVFHAAIIDENKIDEMLKLSVA